MTMNQNNVLESSSSTLALTGLNVVIEDESDYVFVAGGDDMNEIDNLDAEWEDDDDDWTNCDLSPSLSCATSVATNVTLKDLNLVAEDSAMMDVDDNGNHSAMETDEAARDGNNGKSANNASRKGFSCSNPKNGRRLSNKKLRKKMKVLKKAAAARAAAEALAAQKAMASSSESTSAMSEESLPPPVAAPKRTSSPKRKSTNIQVACAQESLAAYREEIEAGKKALKKTRAVSIDLPC